ncbi:MAG TPA: M1 family metallopeptidase [Nitrososphaerales archaeon]|nr:M1 family metallopeptidase [Nitrososphaerales archaeon]
MKIQRYKLSLDIDFDSLLIRGLETITFYSSENELVLDSLGHEIESISYSPNGSSLSFRLDRDRAKLIINLPAVEGYSTQEKSVDIKYTGRVSDLSLHGFYKSRYDGGYFIASDFEPNGARFLFPCIDHPDYKAEFDLEVITQKGLMVTSNCNEKGILPVNEKRSRHIFEQTPPMSTYLIYLGIGNFEIFSIAPGRVTFRALAKPGYAGKGRYALERAVDYVKLYEEYYSVPYVFSKLDLVALPEYTAGAMENWGAITFREVALLTDENSSASNRRNVAVVVGHEIAHQWFGDLVTMKWWNDLWLNESFATFMETKMTDKLFPEWNVWSDFLQDSTSGAMMGDSLRSTHPIEADVKAPEEISQIFDEISYGKGASILRMIEVWMGEVPFRNGIRRYLKDFPYSNATGADLWKRLEEESGLPVSEVMEAWIKKPGYPVMRVSLQEKELLLSQEKFQLAKAGDLSTGQDLWPIPVVAIINGETRHLLIKDRAATLLFRAPLSGIELNVGQAGFYRVLYDDEIYSVISKEFSALSPLARWGILSDLFVFLIADQAVPQLYFDFVRLAMDDTSYIMVDTLTNQLQFLRSIVPSNALASEVYLTYHRRQIEPLGLEARSGESDNDKILRSRIAIGLALEDDQFAKKLSKGLAKYDRVTPDLRTATAVAFARQSGERGFNELIATMKKMANEADVIKLLFALTSYLEPELVKRALDFTLTGEISRADCAYAVSGACSNPAAREVTWNWVTENLQTLLELFRGTGNVSFLMQEVISRTGIGRVESVKDYLSKTRIEEADRGITKGLELLDAYSNLAERLSRQ